MNLSLKPEQMKIAVNYLKTLLHRSDIIEMSKSRKENGQFWYIEEHLGFFMNIRNCLRQVILDVEVPTGNWDDYYIDVINKILDDYEKEKKMFEYNMDNDLRMNIIMNRKWDSSKLEEIVVGGIYNFKIHKEILQELIDNNFVDLKDKQNCAPSICDFIKFVDKYPSQDISFIGYAVMPDRDDYRISIEGLECDYVENRDFVVDFISTFKNADELYYINEKLYCWYD